MMKIIVASLSLILIQSCSSYVSEEAKPAKRDATYSGSADSEAENKTDKDAAEQVDPAQPVPEVKNPAPVEGGTEVVEKPTVPAPIEKPTDGMTKPGDTPAETPLKPGQLIKNGVYAIKSVSSQKCLQPENKSRTAATVIVQEPCAEEPTQLFKIVYGDDKFYRFTVQGSELALEVKDGIVVNEARIQQNTANTQQSQQFSIEVLASGAHVIRPRVNPALCMDVSFASTANGAFIQLWKDCSQPNEHWVLVPKVQK